MLISWNAGSFNIATVVGGRCSRARCEYVGFVTHIGPLVSSFYDGSWRIYGAANAVLRIRLIYGAAKRS